MAVENIYLSVLHDGQPIKRTIKKSTLKSYAVYFITFLYTVLKKILIKPFRDVRLFRFFRSVTTLHTINQIFSPEGSFKLTQVRNFINCPKAVTFGQRAKTKHELRIKSK